MRVLTAALLASSLAACATSSPLPRATAPEPLKVEANANPDVIWVIRQVVVDSSRVDPKVPTIPMYGLFACYRMPAERAGAPQCYMASYSYKTDDLSWPGALYIGTDGVVRPYYSLKPAN
jgi:hypothetical protein